MAEEATHDEGKGIVGTLFSIKVPVVLVVVLVLIFLGAGGYTVKFKPEVLGLSTDGQAALQAEAQTLISNIGKLIELPANEQPTIATVTDVEKVKDQTFFKNAQNGDKVLIYTNERKAILYRPDENRIVEVGAVNINQQNQGDVEGIETQDGEPESNIFENVTLALYNGTDTSGLTKEFESQLGNVTPGTQVSARDNASSNQYEETLLITVDGNQEVAQALSDALGIRTSDLPEGEEAPGGVDFLIILGSDKAS